MPATLFTMDAAIIYIGDTGLDGAEYLSINSVKIPALKEVTKDHQGGGASMGISLGMGLIEKLELTFKLQGINPTTMVKFMSPARRRIDYTIRGSYRDLTSQNEYPVKAIVNGRMMSVEAGEFQRDQGIETDYMIGEIFRYQLWLDGIEKFYFDYPAGPAGIRIDGQLPFQGQARNLGLV